MEVSGQLQPDREEGLEVQFFSPDDLPEGIYPECRMIIESYLKYRDQGVRGAQGNKG